MGNICHPGDENSCCGLSSSRTTKDGAKSRRVDKYNKGSMNRYVANFQMVEKSMYDEAPDETATFSVLEGLASR